MSTKQTNAARNGSDEREIRTDRRLATKPLGGQRLCDDGGAASLRVVQLQRLPCSRRRRNRAAADGRRLEVRQRPRQHLYLDRRGAPQRHALVARQGAGIPGLADRHLRPDPASRPIDCLAARSSPGAHAGRRRIGVAMSRTARSAPALLIPFMAGCGTYAALDTASPDATRITNLHWLIFWVTGVVSLAVIAALAIALTRRRRA